MMCKNGRLVRAWRGVEFSAEMGSDSQEGAGQVLGCFEVEQEPLVVFGGHIRRRIRPMPECPCCGGPMVERSSRFGLFWGCRKYPKCKGTRERPRNKQERQELGEKAANRAVRALHRAMFLPVVWRANIK